MRWLAGGNFKSACKIDLVSQMPHAQQYADARIAKFNIVLEKIVTVCNNGGIATIISNTAPELYIHQISWNVSTQQRLRKNNAPQNRHAQKAKRPLSQRDGCVKLFCISEICCHL